MANLSQIELGLMAWCTAEIGSTVFIMQNQNAQVPPTGSFCVLNVLNVIKIGQDAAFYKYLPITDKIQETIEGPRSLTISINFYRDSAFDQILQLQASLKKQRVTELLYKNGLSFQNVSDIRNLTGIISAKWEERYQMDVNFYVTSTYSEQLERIIKVPVKGNVDGIITSQLIQ